MLCFFFFGFPDLPTSGEDCPGCNKGQLKSVTKDYKVKLPEGDTVTVANLSFRECETCGETVFSALAAQRIDQAIADHTEPLTPEELTKLREVLQANKPLLAESLGLGSKTWLRWESGEQSISRSMGYFIRAMAQFPEVYQWVAGRAWRKNLKK